MPPNDPPRFTVAATLIGLACAAALRGTRLAAVGARVLVLIAGAIAPELATRTTAQGDA